MKLKDKVALITGASKGIGRGIAERYVEEGAIVVLASRSESLLIEVNDVIKAAGGRSCYFTMDVRDADSIQSVVDKTVEKFGKLDIMVNNAGASMVHPSETLSVEDWTRTMETDLFGVFYGCQSAGRQMMKQEGGCIINVSSMYGSVAAPMRTAYCTSKAGVNMLTKVLAVEWADRHIRINGIAPGYIKTELVEDLISKGTLPVDSLTKRTPLGRLGEVKDVLGAAVFLASDEADFITGSNITMDGGWSAYGYL